MCVYAPLSSNPEHCVSRRTGAWTRRGCAEHKREEEIEIERKSERKRNEGITLTLDTEYVVAHTAEVLFDMKEKCRAMWHLNLIPDLTWL